MSYSSHFMSKLVCQKTQNTISNGGNIQKATFGLVQFTNKLVYLVTKLEYSMYYGFLTANK